MNKIWTDEEKDFVRDNASTMKDEDMAKELSKLANRTVTLQSVRKCRQKLGIKKKRGRGICGIDMSPRVNGAEEK